MKTREVVVAGSRWRLQWDAHSFGVSKYQHGKWYEYVSGAGRLDLQWMLKKADEAAEVFKGTNYKAPVPREVYVALMGN